MHSADVSCPGNFLIDRMARLVGKRLSSNLLAQNDCKPNRVSVVGCGVCLVQTQRARPTGRVAFTWHLPPPSAKDETGGARLDPEAHAAGGAFGNRDCRSAIPAALACGICRRSPLLTRTAPSLPLGTRARPAAAEANSVGARRQSGGGIGGKACAFTEIGKL